MRPVGVRVFRSAAVETCTTLRVILQCTEEVAKLKIRTEQKAG